MENRYTKSLDEYNFLYDKKSPDFFAKIDYLLRSGVHLQRDYPLPGELFRFVERNFESLSAYYKNLFRVVLCEGGSEFDRYYYIDFNDSNKGNISGHYRDYLKTEYIIVGILFFKLYKLDGNIELSSVSDFITVLFSEYEEEIEALRKLIADASTSKSSDFNDTKVEEVIKKAFSKFHELGWIAWEDNKDKDSFNYMPSFERLRLMYQPQILAVDDLIKDLDNEE